MSRPDESLEPAPEIYVDDVAQHILDEMDAANGAARPACAEDDAQPCIANVLCWAMETCLANT